MAKLSRNILLFICIFIASFTLQYDSSAAIKKENWPVKKISIIGAEKYNKDSVADFAKIKIGDSIYKNSAIRNAIKNLYATGFYSDVKIKFNKGELIISVRENPIIFNVNLEENDKISEVVLRKSLNIKAGEVYQKSKVINQCKIFQKEYEKRGVYGTRVKPKLIHIDKHRVGLTFEFLEGDYARIRQINFVNSSLPAEELKLIIHSKEHTPLKIFSDSSKLMPEYLNFDQKIITEKYKSIGYANFGIVDVITEYSKAKKGFIITFIFDEGDKYTFRKVKVIREGKGLAEENFMKHNHCKEGALFNKRDIVKTEKAFKALAISKGMSFANIEKNIILDEEKKEVDVVFKITKDIPTYVRNIIIKNNLKTLDKVIRREMAVMEGDAYSADKINLSQRKISGLNYFSSVEISEEATGTPSLVDLVCTVKEKKTGDLKFHVSYADNKKFGLKFAIKENNFGGSGKGVEIYATSNAKEKNVGFSITDPHFFNNNALFGFGASHFRRPHKKNSKVEKTKEEKGSSHSRGNTAFAKVGYEVSENVSHIIKYSISHNKETHLKNTSEFIKAHKGKYTTSSISNTIIYDTLNKGYRPTSGSKVSFGQELAILGGSNKFAKHTVEANRYFPISTLSVLKISAEAGIINGIGDNLIRRDFAFLLGSENVCGFESEGIGPRDKTTKESLGGKKMYAASGRFMFPIKRGSGLYGAVFAEGASVYDADIVKGLDKSKMLNNENNLRFAIGVGVEWDSAFGPLRFDLGVPLMKRDGDELQAFRFSFGI